MKFLFSLMMVLSNSAIAQSFTLFAGSYTNTGGKGIYVYKFDVGTGKATLISTTESVNPSYLAMSPGGKYLYSVNETGGADSGGVSAFAYDKLTGKLSFINQQNTGGDHPCHISVDKSNQWVFVSNYNGGNISALRINPDGSLKPYAQLIQNSGSSIVKPNQERSHVHGSFFSPDEKYLYTTDLGIDKVLMYNVNTAATRPLTPFTTAFIESRPGSGPRHLTFHPNGKFAYVIEELSGTVAAYAYSEGGLAPIQRISSHRSRYAGKIASADIHVSPDGKFLYASNRGDANTIAIFSINRKTGMLTSVGYQSTLGKAPRNFVIDPTGNLLLVANQDTDNIVVFKRNKKTGRLSPSGEVIKVLRPVFLMFRR